MVHQIRIKLPTHEVENKGVEIAVRENTRKLGTLLIYKGNIEWLPAKKQKKRAESYPPDALFA